MEKLRSAGMEVNAPMANATASQAAARVMEGPTPASTRPTLDQAARAVQAATGFACEWIGGHFGRPAELQLQSEPGLREWRRDKQNARLQGRASSKHAQAQREQREGPASKEAEKAAGPGRAGHLWGSGVVGRRWRRTSATLWSASAWARMNILSTPTAWSRDWIQ